MKKTFLFLFFTIFISINTFASVSTQGNIGIGTSVPSCNLHIYATSGAVCARLEVTASNNGVMQVQNYNDSGKELSIGKIGTNFNLPAFGSGSGAILNRDGNFNIIGDSNDPIIFYTDETDTQSLSATEKMRLRPTGEFQVSTDNLSMVYIDPVDGIILSGNATVWEDAKFPASRLRQGVSQKPDFDPTNVGLLFPQNDETEIVYINFQFPHKMKINDGKIVTSSVINIHPHIHYVQDETATADFTLEYRIYEIGGDPTISFTTITTNENAVEYSSGSIHQYLEFPEIDISDINTVSAIMDIKLYRTSGDGVAGDVLVKEFDIHYELNSMGSRKEDEK